MMDGARGYRKVNQGSTEMMSASVTKWRAAKGREFGKGRFIVRGN